ncbi:hypothetical protein SPRG_00852 [Saprolegnia parasitica CBS 223.65]|uniref:Uncharacterized protein n=1 Tax=Saprolegnia parasitica (strain CBS 223.65) TaxID=695850 RepID=A0A067D812_SAPPC|nr:hypothetical protein SPRG_00852 [Saprolegnia parasitica CBS 223.65]KDO34791.1 hypothetical protein SPRG_00852 [Saprolegnia parasitica CBS 223.65]|eukprot:XP_012194458.1 hypothetical protein SPRG_00852 [Saprolegnia parasitica CBS 223.65]
MHRILLGLRPFAYNLLTAAKAAYDTQLRLLLESVQTIEALQTTVATKDTTIGDLGVADLHEAARVQRVAAAEIRADLKVQERLPKAPSSQQVAWEPDFPHLSSLY